MPGQLGREIPQKAAMHLTTWFVNVAHPVDSNNTPPPAPQKKKGREQHKKARPVGIIPWILFSLDAL